MSGAPLLRVLVVDDDELTSDLVTRSLSSDGCEVVVAAGAAAIAATLASFSPDVVLVDVNIPGLGEGAAVGLVREASRAPVRVFLFSADDEAVLRGVARRVGADGWLSKSTAITDLGARLRAHLSR